MGRQARLRAASRLRELRRSGARYAGGETALTKPLSARACNASGAAAAARRSVERRAGSTLPRQRRASSGARCHAEATFQRTARFLGRTTRLGGAGCHVTPRSSIPCALPQLSPPAARGVPRRVKRAPQPAFGCAATCRCRIPGDHARIARPACAGGSATAASASRRRSGLGCVRHGPACTFERRLATPAAVRRRSACRRGQSVVGRRRACDAARPAAAR